MINAGTVAASLTLDTNKFTAGMKSANAQLAAFQDESLTAAQKFQGVGGGLATIGGTLTKSVTLPLAGAGLAALGVAANFDEGMSRVAAISGAAGNELDNLRNKAREMGAKTKFSATEAAAAFEYMAMTGWKSGEMMDGIEGVMNLAAASGEDLATTSDIVTDALTAFGLKAKDSGHFADILAAASSNANTNVSMMGETFKYAAPIAGALGFSAEDTAEAIGLMANAGIKGSQGGTYLRAVMNALAGEVKFTGKELGKVTIETTNADGSMRQLSDILADCRGAFAQMTESEKAANAETLAGREGMTGFLALMNAAPADIEKLSSAIADCDGTAERMAGTMQDNLKGQLTILKSQTEELAISIGSELMPVAQGLIGKAQGIMDTFNGLDGGTKRMIVNAGLVAAAIGPTAGMLGKLTTGVGSLITTASSAAAAFTAAGGGVAGLGSALVSVVTPAGLVVAGLAAVAAVGTALYLAHRNATKGTRELGEAMKGAAKYADEFKSGLTVSAGNTDGFLSDFNAGFNLSDVETKIREVQGKITEITSKATSERGYLTQKEIDRINEYLKELRELTDSEFEYYNSNLGAMQSIISDGYDMTAENAQKSLSRAQSYRDSALDSAYQAYEFEVAQIEKTEEKDSEAYKKRKKEAKEHYEQQQQMANESYAEVISTIANAYAEQNMLDSDFYAALQQHNADVEIEKARHHQAVAALREAANNGDADANAKLEQEMVTHQNNLEKIHNEMAGKFDENAQEIIGTLMAMLDELEKNDGEMTGEARQFVTDFLACYDNLPSDMRKTMDSAVEGMRRALSSGKPKIMNEAKGMADGVANVLRSGWKVNSPSRVMMEIGGYATKGLELGLAGGKDSLYRTASQISTDTAEALGGIARARYDYQVPPTDYGDRLDRLLDAVERLTASEPVMQIDGRPFGRLVREYV